MPCFLLFLESFWYLDRILSFICWKSLKNIFINSCHLFDTMKIGIIQQIKEFYDLNTKSFMKQHRNIRFCRQFVWMMWILWIDLKFLLFINDKIDVNIIYIYCCSEILSIEKKKFWFSIYIYIRDSFDNRYCQVQFFHLRYCAFPTVVHCTQKEWDLWN